MNNGTNKRMYRQTICQNKCGNFIRNSTRYLEGWTGRKYSKYEIYEKITDRYKWLRRQGNIKTN